MPTFNISNGTIQDITFERDTAFVTVTYMENRDNLGNRRNEQTIVLIVRPRTVILNSNGIPVPVTTLRRGMIINANVSSAMTRSIPPQANAYVIRILRRQPQESITVGRILEIDRRNRSFTTISDLNPSTIIRFNGSDDTRIFDRFGRPAGFSRLNQGMRVRVRHANFMTASIPPQTTAFEVQIL